MWITNAAIKYMCVHIYVHTHTVYVLGIWFDAHFTLMWVLLHMGYQIVEFKKEIH